MSWLHDRNGTFAQKQVRKITHSDGTFPTTLNSMSSDSPATPERSAFADRLVLVRKQAGYKSKASFARKLGIEEARYRKWERAGSEPDLHHLCKIQRITGVSLDYLIAGLVPGLSSGTFPVEPSDGEHRRRA